MNNDNNLEFCIAGVNCRAGYATVCQNGHLDFSSGFQVIDPFNYEKC